VSSILEALRELEGTKPSAQRSRVAWASGEAEERSPMRRAAELLGIVAFGLALGGVGFAAIVWLGSPDAHATRLRCADGFVPSSSRRASRMELTMRRRLQRRASVAHIRRPRRRGRSA